MTGVLEDNKFQTVLHQFVILNQARVTSLEKDSFECASGCEC